MLVGGEGMTEELRDRLLERFESVYSGYGATDLEIGMAGESPVSIALRRLARARPDIRGPCSGATRGLPMVFQYNPLIHFLEVNAEHEIVCTVSRLDLLAPRIRYNVHDEGGLLSFGRVRSRAARLRIDIRTLGQAAETAGPRGPLPWARPIPLPFLWIHGRRDATISVMGSNIYPEDIETIVYRDPAILPRLESFMPDGPADDRDATTSHRDRSRDGHGRRPAWTRRFLGSSATASTALISTTTKLSPSFQRRWSRSSRSSPSGADPSPAMPTGSSPGAWLSPGRN